MEYERKTPHQTPIRRKIILLLIPVIIAICSIAGYKIYKHYNYTGELVGIVGSKVYHRDNCQFVKKAGAGTIVLFQDKMKAAEAGFRACNTCNAPDNSEEIAIVKRKIEEAKKEADAAAASKKSDGTGWTVEKLRKYMESQGIKQFDINKCEILGSSVNKSPYSWTITGTVKNNNDSDVVSDIFVVQAIFYDKDKKPIATKSARCIISAGKIEGFIITQYENISNINSYELSLVR